MLICVKTNHKENAIHPENLKVSVGENGMVWISTPPVLVSLMLMVILYEE